MFGSLRGFEIPLYEEFRRLQREVDALFAVSPMPGTPPASGDGTRRAHLLAHRAFPSIDIVGGPDKVDVYLTAPGIDVGSLDLSIQQNVLAIRGRREAPAGNAASRQRQERFSGEFRRAITLPEDVDPERVTASYVDGIVRIRVQRRETARPRKIEIH